MLLDVPGLDGILPFWCVSKGGGVAFTRSCATERGDADHAAVTRHRHVLGVPPEVIVERWKYPEARALAERILARSTTKFMQWLPDNGRIERRELTLGSTATHDVRTHCGSIPRTSRQLPPLNSAGYRERSQRAVRRRAHSSDRHPAAAVAISPACRHQSNAGGIESARR